MEPFHFELEPRRKPIPMFVWVFVIVFGVAALFFLGSAPRQIPVDTFVQVRSGQSLGSVARDLYEKKYIRSTVFFQTLVTLYAGDRSIVMGDYYIDKPISVWTLAQRMVAGDYNVTQVRLTFWEGMNVREMADLLSGQIPSIDTNLFIKAAEKREGYLFPDTYFFSPVATIEDVISQMEDNFVEKIKPFESEILAFGSTKHEIVTMASIIEKESNGMDDREIISSILWNRIELGMPLQVDASFVYLLGKESRELTLNDLKFDSPYNTYLYKGLPPGPIGNPGVESIRAALNPADTDYLFYLHSKDGSIYFAKTFAEHVKNKQKYLR